MKLGFALSGNSIVCWAIVTKVALIYTLRSSIPDEHLLSINQDKELDV